MISAPNNGDARLATRMLNAIRKAGGAPARRRAEITGEPPVRRILRQLLLIAHEFFCRHCEVHQTRVDDRVLRPRGIGRESDDADVRVADLKRSQELKITVTVIRAEQAEQGSAPHDSHASQTGL